MKIYFVSLLLLFVSVISFAQADTVSLKEAVVQLDQALLQKDTVILLDILDRKVSFGHSNGWTEGKKDIISDLSSGYLYYEKLETFNLEISTGKKWASVRMKVGAKGIVNKKSFDLQLYVLQVWIKEKNKWKLIARQSTKLNN